MVFEKSLHLFRGEISTHEKWIIRFVRGDDFALNVDLSFEKKKEDGQAYKRKIN